MELIRSPALGGVLRAERGVALDLYPSEVADFPVPRAWLENNKLDYCEALGLSERQKSTLENWSLVR